MRRGALVWLASASDDKRHRYASFLLLFCSLLVPSVSLHDCEVYASLC